MDPFPKCNAFQNKKVLRPLRLLKLGLNLKTPCVSRGSSCTIALLEQSYLARKYIEAFFVMFLTVDFFSRKPQGNSKHLESFNFLKVGAIFNQLGPSKFSINIEPWRVLVGYAISTDTLKSHFIFQISFSTNPIRLVGYIRKPFIKQAGRILSLFFWFF